MARRQSNAAEQWPVDPEALEPNLPPQPEAAPEARKGKAPSFAEFQAQDEKRTSIARGKIDDLVGKLETSVDNMVTSQEAGEKAVHRKLTEQLLHEINAIAKRDLALELPAIKKRLDALKARAKKQAGFFKAGAGEATEAHERAAILAGGETMVAASEPAEQKLARRRAIKKASEAAELAAVHPETESKYTAELVQDIKETKARKEAVRKGAGWKEALIDFAHQDKRFKKDYPFSVKQLKEARREVDEDEDAIAVERAKTGFFGKTARLLGFKGPSTAEQRARLNRPTLDEWNDVYDLVDTNKALVKAYEASFEEDKRAGLLRIAA